MKPRLFFLGLCLLSLLGCERRELTDDPQEGVAVRIDVDWSTLRTGEEKQRHMKALLYPTGGGAPVERYLMNPDGGEVFVPEGDYHIIVYNWRTNAEAQTIQFRGTGNYFTHEAYTAEVARSKAGIGQETRQSAVEPVIAQPDHLYSWSTKDTPRRITRKGSNGNIVIKTPVEDQIYFYHFTVDINNPYEIRSIESTIGGTRGWVRLADGRRSEGSHATDVTITRLDWGEVKSARFLISFRTFGVIKGLPNRITIRTINPDGLEETHFTKDISDIIDQINQKLIDNTTPYHISDPSGPITVTPGEKKEGSGFTPPIVKGWEPEHGGDIDI